MSSIYIHIPFCRQACHYCNFHFSTQLARKQEVIAAIATEVGLRANYLFDSPTKNNIDTLYFGGGTPSLLNVDELRTIFDALEKNYSWSNATEITLECNPDDITAQSLGLWKDFGINRLSIGVQSFDDDILKMMNRSHDAATAIRAVRMADDAGFDNISVDLIYGLPGLSSDDWLKCLHTVWLMNVKHISCYALTIEERTALSHFVKHKTMAVPGDDVVASQFMELMLWVKANGFEHYEISNFCRPGFQSRHNSNYWSGKNYIGLGPSAHSYNGCARQWNVANNSQYLEALKNNLPYFEEEVLTPQNKYNEYVMLGLRTSTGVNVLALEQIFGLREKEYFETAIEQYVQQQMAEKVNKVYKLTPTGMLFADAIASDCFM